MGIFRKVKGTLQIKNLTTFQNVQEAPHKVLRTSQKVHEISQKVNFPDFQRSSEKAPSASPDV